MKLNDITCLQSETHQKIPKIIWQTSKHLPDKKSGSLISSWLSNNPDYSWKFMDDKRCDLFVKENFIPEFYSMYKALPIGVMRADVWRVAVVYAYGGVYCDTDTLCLQPISGWVSAQNKLVVGVEVSAGDLLNYTFAAVPKHPALLSVLNEFLELFNTDSFMKNSECPVQNFGQYGFSHGILNYYNMSSRDQMSLGGVSNYYNENAQVISDNTKFILYQDNKLSNRIFKTTCVQHQCASVTWNNPDYSSWRKEQERFISERS